MSNDSLSGGPGNDRIFGGVGNDTITGEDGNDTLFGQDGNDRLIGGAGADLIDGGSGFDIADYRTSSAGVLVRLEGEPGSGGDAQGDRLISVEGVIGSAFSDTFVTNPFLPAYIEGKAGNDFFFGAAGNDTFIGQEGSDRFFGRGGSDRLDGGAGFDIAYYTESTEAVNIRLDGTAARGGTAEGDTLTLVEGVIGSEFNDTFVTNPFFGGYVEGKGGDDVFYGAGGRETFVGGAGNDKLLGRGGADKLIGGEGFDIAYYTSSDEGVSVRLDGSLSSGGDAEGDELILVNGVIGSAFADVVVTNAFLGGYVEGNAGNDIVYGNGARETFVGGAGRDVFVSGGGNDSFIGGSGADRLVFGRNGDSDEFEDFSTSSGDDVRLTGFGAAFDTFAEVRDAATDTQSGALIDFGQGDTLLLAGTSVSELRADDFDFA